MLCSWYTLYFFLTHSHVRSLSLVDLVKLYPSICVDIQQKQVAVCRRLCANYQYVLCSISCAIHLQCCRLNVHSLEAACLIPFMHRTYSCALLCAMRGLYRSFVNSSSLTAIDIVHIRTVEPFLSLLKVPVLTALTLHSCDWQSCWQRYWIIRVEKTWR